MIDKMETAVRDLMGLFDISEAQALYEIRCMFARNISIRNCPTLTALGIANQGPY